MTKSLAVSVAVARVKETGFTFVIVRRGYSYRAQISSYPVARGWAVAEMIAPGNVHNFDGTNDEEAAIARAEGRQA